MENSNISGSVIKYERPLNFLHKPTCFKSSKLRVRLGKLLNGETKSTENISTAKRSDETKF